MDPDKPEDQKNFTRWVIEAALREYPPGEVENPQSLASRVGAADEGDEILQEIKVEGQRDIDAEVC